jgi:hypothetical protein
VIADSLEVESIFVSDKGELLKIRNHFGSEGNVKFYNVSDEQPLAVFSNFEFMSTQG